MQGKLRLSPTEESRAQLQVERKDRGVQKKDVSGILSGRWTRKARLRDGCGEWYQFLSQDPRGLETK